MLKYAAYVTISREAQDMLQEDVYRRQQIEACGLLLGQIDSEGHWHVEQIHPMRNMHNSPVYFEFVPEDLLEAELLYSERIIGAYHSHPTGFAKASSTDRGNMKRVNIEQDIPWVWLIIRGPFNEHDHHHSTLSNTTMIAYHHYRNKGLCQIEIKLEDAQEQTSDIVTTPVRYHRQDGCKGPPCLPNQ